jgi:lipopolysaccharide transport system permease protein/teichoic acid transport system permease protein
MYYIVEGYRAAFIYHSKLWTGQMVYFWVLALALFIVGGLIFRRLKSEFAEVL